MQNKFELRHSIDKLNGMINDLEWYLETHKDLPPDQFNSTMEQIYELQSMAHEKVRELELFIESNLT